MLKYKRMEMEPPDPPNRLRAIWRAKKLLCEVIYDITALEGNPHTVPEIATVLEGITVGGHRITDQEQVRNVKGWRLWWRRSGDPCDDGNRRRHHPRW